MFNDKPFKSKFSLIVWLNIIAQMSRKLTPEKTLNGFKTDLFSGITAHIRKVFLDQIKF